ncbi:MAG: hypothetical protein KDE63_10345 [Novosphingobium sp.]|nr:hypothetical protein [Novosphingobium sp.]
MARKKCTPEQIIGILREAEVRLSQGEKICAIDTKACGIWTTGGIGFGADVIHHRERLEFCDGSGDQSSR